jgi:succinyldiaminopimelate transaminase
VSARGPALPDYPWDALAEHAAVAGRHPDGIVDLSVGTPVDPTPQVAARALAAASDSPGYPRTAGSAALQRAALGWLSRNFGVDPAATSVLPTIGSKELVASLPAQLGLGAGDTVATPVLAYPTYEVGALLAGARALRTADVTAADPDSVGLVWLNSPANPDGSMLAVEELRGIVQWARSGARQVVVASDECYAALAWDAPFVSLLDPRVTGGDSDGLVAVHSLSKRSNLAGYRAAFLAGDPALVARLLAVRRHAGLIMPDPVQRAMVAVLDDEAHASQQRERYRHRRETLAGALAGAGLRLGPAPGGLYLWASGGESGWATVARLAELGILVAPGAFYGPAGERHVRVALTATDERIAAAAARLNGARLNVARPAGPR